MLNHLFRTQAPQPDGSQPDDIAVSLDTLRRGRLAPSTQSGYCSRLRTFQRFVDGDALHLHLQQTGHQVP